MSGPLFKPFRALGYITEDVPFAVQRRGKETYVVVSVGRTWQVGPSFWQRWQQRQQQRTVTATVCCGCFALGTERWALSPVSPAFASL